MPHGLLTIWASLERLSSPSPWLYSSAVGAFWLGLRVQLCLASSLAFSVCGEIAPTMVPVVFWKSLVIASSLPLHLFLSQDALAGFSNLPLVSASSRTPSHTLGFMPKWNL